jgi:hypothetical protein
VIGNQPHSAPPPARRSGRLSRRKGFLFRLVCLGLSFAAGCLGVEVILRLCWEAPLLPAAADSLVADAEMGLIHVPNYRGFHHTASFTTRLQTNSHGLRDVEHDWEKPDGVKRILALGDSFVMGHGVEFDQMFAAVAERAMLTECPTPRTEIIKAGVGGWGPRNQLAFLRKQGLRYQPDHILLVFYVGNDFGDAGAPRQYALWNGLRVRAADAVDPTPAYRARTFMRKHVYAYGASVDALKGLTMTRETRYQDDLETLRICLGTEVLAPQAAAACLDELQTLAKEAGIGFSVLALPHRIQIESPRRERIAREFNLSLDSFDADRPTRVIAQLLNERGITMLDPTLTLLEVQAAHGAISFEADSHYTAAAHAALGNYVAKALCENVISAR